jgi:hypothetical protein
MTSRTSYIGSDQTIFKKRISKQTAKVADIMLRDGGITKLVSQHYKIGNLYARLGDLRKAGLKVGVQAHKDAEGSPYSRWVFGDTNVGLAHY